MFMGTISTNPNSVVGTSAPTLSADLAWYIEGHLLCSASGTFVVFAAGEVATASASAPWIQPGANGVCFAIAAGLPT